MKLNRKPITHELKILPEYFNEVRSHNKHFELRKDDREYRLAHKEEIRVKRRARYLANREKLLAQQKEYYLLHKDEISAKMKAKTALRKQEIQNDRTHDRTRNYSLFSQIARTRDYSLFKRKRN